MSSNKERIPRLTPGQSRLIWSLLTAALAFLSIRLVIGFSGGMSLKDFLSAFQSARPGYLFLALLGMFGFVFFEGEAVLCILRHIGYSRRHHRGFIYAAADAYFSAVTPSATGGQPASAFFMIRDGIPATTVTATLVFNLIMYSLAALTNGLICFLIRPSFFMNFTHASKLLIGIGLIVLIGLSVLFWLILKKRSLIPVITEKLVNALTKIHIIHHPQKHIEKMKHITEEYGQAVDLMTGQKRTVIMAFLFNLLQRISQISVTVTMYLALGGSASKALPVYITQSMVVLGSNSVPIPGSMGVTDALMLDGFMSLMSREEAFRLELLSRSISFYLCVMLSGLVVLIAYAAMKIRQNRRYRC